MSVFGIICEFNPIHTGHQYLLRTARQRGADTVVCIMSGATTQRGEFAIADPYLRAKAAILAGADLVIELPFPWCSASAEGFAMGGIEVVKHFADTVIFGSECGDLSLLRQAADAASSPRFKEAFQKALQGGEGAARAYCDCLTQSGIPPLSSNDLLGVAYLRAATEQNADLSFQTVQRHGAAYRQTALHQAESPSAMAIRRLWSEGKFEEAVPAIPKECVKLFREAVENGEITSERELDSVWLSFFRLHDAEDFADCLGCEGGLAQRICASARQARSYEELLQTVKTKRYTDAHIRRAMLFCLASVTKQDVKATPQYTTVLAMNQRGQRLLAQKRKELCFPVITKAADAPRDTVQFQATQRIHHIFAMATKTKHTASEMITKTPYIEK